MLFLKTDIILGFILGFSLGFIL